MSFCANSEHVDATVVFLIPECCDVHFFRKISPVVHRTVASFKNAQPADPNCGLSVVKDCGN
jgi:hypothetical protein